MSLPHINKLYLYYTCYSCIRRLSPPLSSSSPCGPESYNGYKETSVQLISTPPLSKVCINTLCPCSGGASQEPERSYLTADICVLHVIYKIRDDVDPNYDSKCHWEGINYSNPSYMMVLEINVSSLHIWLAYSRLENLPSNPSSSSVDQHRHCTSCSGSVLIPMVTFHADTDRPIPATLDIFGSPHWNSMGLPEI